MLNEEENKFSACQAMLREAEAGNVRIITSAPTTAEVLWPKGSRSLPPET